MLQTRCRENQNRYFMSNNPFCPKIDNVQKYGTAGQATDDNTAHTYCRLDT